MAAPLPLFLRACHRGGCTPRAQIPTVPSTRVHGLPFHIKRALCGSFLQFLSLAGSLSRPSMLVIDIGLCAEAATLEGVGIRSRF